MILTVLFGTNHRKENVVVDLQFVSDFVNTYFTNVSIMRNGTQFNCRCALCGDSKKNTRKKRFYLTYDGNSGGVYYCHNCHETGSFVKLYSLLSGTSIAQSLKIIFKYDKSAIKNQLTKKKTEKVEEQVGSHNYILDDCVMKVEGYQQSKYNEVLLQFKKDRNIPDDTPIYIAYKGKYKNRIIIPICDKKNNILYFQARRIYKNQEPKYLNPISKKRDVIFNRHKFDRKKYIIIVEGLLDAISIGDQGTVCLGSSITDDFIHKIMRLTDKGVIIALDNDETGKKEQQKIIKKSIYAKKVRYFLYPYVQSDINSINTNYDIDIYKMIIDNSFELHGVKARNLF